MFSRKNSLIESAEIAQLNEELGILLAEGRPLCIDSRKITAGGVFCAYPGTQGDGRDYITQAVAAGAAGILWEPGIEFQAAVPNWPLSNLMHKVGLLAAEQAKHPSRAFDCIAITGTNGKTSISHWLNQALSALGQRTAIIGTTGAGIYPQVADYSSTTPDPLTLQQLLVDFKSAQVASLAMEVSSHALVQGRVNGVAFKTAVFTNLTQDHLDYHQTMENYYLAKEQLFFWQGLESAVINLDDSYGQRLSQVLSQENPQLLQLTYGIDAGELRASQVQLSRQGVQFSLEYRGLSQLIQAQLLGRFNVYNLLAVSATLLLKGITWKQLPALIAQLTPVTGRMDAQIIASKPLVVVDFSHTPDALAKALETLNEIKASGRLWCVFGCGGNRDRGKRPLMGQIAAALADYPIVTTDNPRYEAAAAIIDEVVVGLAAERYLRIESRQAAIEYAIQHASVNDIVLIAGKGHENYQDIQGVKHPFSDLEVAAQSLYAYHRVD